LLLCRHRAGTPNTEDITAIVFLKKKNRRIPRGSAAKKKNNVPTLFLYRPGRIVCKSRPSLKLANREYLSLRGLAKL